MKGRVFDAKMAVIESGFSEVTDKGIKPKATQRAVNNKVKLPGMGWDFFRYIGAKCLSLRNSLLQPRNM